MKFAIKFFESELGLWVFVELGLLLLARIGRFRRTISIIAVWLLLLTLPWRVRGIIWGNLAFFGLLASGDATTCCSLQARSCNSVTVIIGLILTLTSGNQLFGARIMFAIFSFLTVL